MNTFLVIFIAFTSFLALYWIFWGQRRHNEMFAPKRKTRLKAVLFDMDGVILDSFEAWYSVFNQVRKKFDLKGISRDEFRKNVWGGSVEADTKNYFKDKDVKEIESLYLELVSKSMSKTVLLPGAKDVLNNIKNKKIKIGLVTNTFEKPTLAALNFHKIKRYFNAIITRDDVEKVKPSPESILKLCEKLKVTPDEAILVGDTKYDFKAGKAAGVFVVGFKTEGDIIISNLSDLMQLV